MGIRVRYWGARGSIPTPGADHARYGGNTSCVELTLSDGSELILDAGTGIRELGLARTAGTRSVHLLLTHLHLDHIQGLMFFAPLFDPEGHVRIGGPPSLVGPLLTRLSRYISAPLAPVEIRELPARVDFEDVPRETFRVGPAVVEAMRVNHRGPTLAYRVTDGDVTVAYVPDHEPALGQAIDGCPLDWLSGSSIARDADLLIHDSQYSDGEYAHHLGWGHCAVSDAVRLGRRCGVKRLALFHHDPLHDDTALDALEEEARSLADGTFEEISLAREGQSIELN